MEKIGTISRSLHAISSGIDFNFRDNEKTGIFLLILRI